MNHGDEGIRPFPPGIAVGDLFQDVGLLGKGIVTNFDVHRKISAHVKRRVDINQLKSALLLYFLTQGTVLKGGEYQLVVAPNKLVGPALELAASAVQGEQA